MLKQGLNNFLITAVVIVFSVILLTLLLLAVSNYPVQWRDQVNKERYRSFEILAQAIEYYVLDHDGAVFDIPSEPALISNTELCSHRCPALGTTLKCFDLDEVLIPQYVSKIPQDPMLMSDTNSGFYISHKDGRLMLGACHRFFKDQINLSQDL